MPTSSVRSPRRRFRVERLQKKLMPNMQPDLGVGATVFTAEILIPVAEKTADGFRRVATRLELRAITTLLCKAFGGVTRPYRKRGYWFSSNRPSISPEQNTHAVFEVVTAPTEVSLKFLRALKHELERALGEDVIFLRTAAASVL
jgi:hypothetical protein